MSEGEQTEVRFFVGPLVDPREFAERLRQLQNEGAPVDLQEIALTLDAERRERETEVD